MLVVDASVAVHACKARTGFEILGDPELHAPALLWSEARSAIREALRREEIGAAQADAARHAIEDCPVQAHGGVELGEEAWRIATELGWAKTYDAAYVALARLLDCRLVALDARLRRGTERLGFVVSPGEL